MNAPFAQKDRLGQLHTDLGPDHLVLLRFTGTDYVNELFEYQVEALSIEPNIDFDALLGTHARVQLGTLSGDMSWFDGIVTHARWVGVGENGNRYDLTLRPWIWLAGQRRNQRIFHKMTAPKILEKLFEPYKRLGNPVYSLRLKKDYPELEYTVQYRESDLDFARRIMERFGISFHFIHTDGNHEMVLIDTEEEHDEIPGGQRPYYGQDGHHQPDEEHFWEWSPERNITTGAMRLTDYNFKRPNAMMEVERIGDGKYTEGQIESFDYPGDYLVQGEGKEVVGLRTEQERGQDRYHNAVGDTSSLKSGMRMRLTGEYVPGVHKDPYLCISASHSYISDSYGSGGQESDKYAYHGSYRFIPAIAPLAPTRKTPLPVVQGPQTAVVVGEGEIDCDEYGRILVRFHWDLNNAYSMRCRVSQNWASKGWGGMIIPRIGMEVVVEFLEGDPDKPLVTGCVYNGQNDPPYALPANKTKSVFKTDTHQGSGFNELSFEDEKDRELIYMHGQKDQQIDILNNRDKTVGQDQSERVARDKSIDIGNNHSETIHNDARHRVDRDVVYDVGRNQQERYGKDHIHNVGNVHKQDIYADHLKIVGRNFEETVKGKYTLNVNQSITNNTKVHTLMAFEKFVIKGPGGKITIDSSSITLEAPIIKLKGAVQMGGGGGAQVPTLQGAANDGLPLVEECLTQKDGE